MNISQTELKAAGTSLRRELKALYGEKAPNHTQCLELLASAFGASSYAQLLTTATESPVRTVQFPLDNVKGRFDLVKPGESGQAACGDTFEVLAGTCEYIPDSTAQVSSSVRLPGGNLEATANGTLVNWDAQRTTRDERGHALWLTEDGIKYSEAQVVLLPDQFDPEDLSLPVRDSLVKAYAKHILQSRGRGDPSLARDFCQPDMLLDSPQLQRVTKVLGFALHLRELHALQHRLLTA